MILVLVLIAVINVSAQEPISGISTSSPVSTIDLEQELFKLKVQQNNTIDALKSSIDTYKTFVQALTWLFAILIVIQTAFSIFQFYKEGQRESRQTKREEKWDTAELRGVDQVSSVMSLVEKTLESRAAAQDQLEKVLNQMGQMQAFINNYQAAAAAKRDTIEEKASDLAKLPRQDFRTRATDINDLAKEVEEFKTDFEPLEIEKKSFSSRVTFIQGIAAHYLNQPKKAYKHLLEVTSIKQPELKEDENDFRRRVANAYYYLGLNESNFGDYDKAIDYFTDANKLDSKNEDFLMLARLQAADNYILRKDKKFDEALQSITDVKRVLKERKHRDGRLHESDNRLWSRAALIEASVIMLKHEPGWIDQAIEILKPLEKDDARYYYATAALAQFHYYKGDKVEAERLFTKGHQTIVESLHLNAVTEVRIKILLLMVAGMCCKHGLKDDKRAGEYLDKADDLRRRLPMIDQRPCTVFSSLSKQNESSERIKDHIEKIREGEVLIKPGS